MLLLLRVASTFAFYRQPHVLQLRGGGAFEDDTETQGSTGDRQGRDGHKQAVGIGRGLSPEVIEIDPRFLDEKRNNDETVLIKAEQDNNEQQTADAVNQDRSSGKDQNSKQKSEEATRSSEGVAFVTKAEKSEMERIDRKINNGLRDRFADASISLQRLLESQKPIALNFAKEVKGRYGDTASKLKTMKSTTFQRLQHLNKSSVNAIIMTRAFDAKHRIKNVSGLAIRSALEYKMSEEMIVILCTFACSLVGTSLGFLSFLYFVSVGYGASVAMIACTLLVVGNVSKAAMCLQIFNLSQVYVSHHCSVGCQNASFYLIKCPYRSYPYVGHTADFFPPS